MGECGSKADVGRTEGHCQVPLMVLWIRMVGQMGYACKYEYDLGSKNNRIWVIDWLWG